MMVHSVLVYTGLWGSLVGAQQAAHNYPGSASFPSEAQWLALNSSLSGAVTNGSTVSTRYSKKAGPAYTASPKTIEEVSKAMQFASEHNLRVAIRGTGHDFMARNGGAGSLLISTKAIKKTEFVQDWAPSVGADAWKERQAGQKTAAVVIGAGQTWKEVLDILEGKLNYTTVHGAEKTVGASGGWAMGGGHGPLSNVYGMGADNILELTVVLANGTVVIANEDSYPDLFFAMRGGGGGTYGLVTHMTMRAFKQPAMHGIRITVTAGDKKEEFLDAVAYFFSMTGKMTDWGISGYPDLASSRFAGRFRAPDKTPEEIDDFMEPIMTKMSALGANVTWVRVADTGSTLFLHQEAQEYAAPYKRYAAARKLRARQSDTLSSLGSDYMVSRLLSRDALVESNQPAIRAMLKSVLARGVVLPYPNFGGQVARNKNLNVGLNPAWRDALMHMIVMGFDGAGSIKAMDALSADSGAYWNEATPSEVNWKKTFFGPEEHYAKLLAVKQKYDPTNRFWCKTCVGNDLLSEGAEGYLQLRSSA